MIGEFSWQQTDAQFWCQTPQLASVSLIELEPLGKNQDTLHPRKTCLKKKELGRTTWLRISWKQQTLQTLHNRIFWDLLISGIGWAVLILFFFFARNNTKRNPAETKQQFQSRMVWKERFHMFLLFRKRTAFPSTKSRATKHSRPFISRNKVIWFSFLQEGRDFCLSREGRKNKNPVDLILFWVNSHTNKQATRLLCGPAGRIFKQKKDGRS